MQNMLNLNVQRPNAVEPQMPLDWSVPVAVVEQVVPDRTVLDYAKEKTAVDGLNEIGQEIEDVTGDLDALIVGKLEVRSKSDTIYLDTTPLDDRKWVDAGVIYHPVTKAKLSVTCNAEADTINTTKEEERGKGHSTTQNRQAPKQLPPENRLMGWDRYVDTYNSLLEKHGIMMKKYEEVCGEE